jgi:hypothetical protein
MAGVAPDVSFGAEGRATCMRWDVLTRERPLPAASAMPAPRCPDGAASGCCPACHGEGSLAITPIHDDGAIWTIMPCEICEGTGVLRCEG